MNSPSARVRAIVAAIALMLIVAACGASPTPPPSADATPSDAVEPSEEASQAPAAEDASLTILVGSFANERWDPRSMAGSSVFQRLYCADLIQADHENRFIPGVAESWEVSDDGLTWTFTIRDDVMFHNGELLTVDDVVFSLQDLFGPEAVEAASPLGVDLGLVTESIEATGPNTVEVRHTTPIPYFIAALGQDGPPRGCILPQAYFEEVGRDGFNREPIGAGPFMVTEITPGQEIQFERFDDYYDPSQLPQFTHLTLGLVPEVATRVQALNAGQADIIQADLTVRDQIEEGGNQAVMTTEAGYPWFMLLGCWEEANPCSDKSVRLALDLALDKELIMGGIYGDAWLNAGWMLATPNVLGYTEELAPREADPDEARRLLAEAGYPDGEGFPPLIINAPSTGGDVALCCSEIALLVAQQWSEVLGIPTEVRVGDLPTLRDRRFAGELDGQVFIRDNDSRWDGASLTRGQYGSTPGNPSSDRLSEDPELLAAVEEAEEAFTPDDREEAYAELYPILREENYEIALGTINAIWGVGPRVQGWEPLPIIPRPTALWTIQLSE